MAAHKKPIWEKIIRRLFHFIHRLTGKKAVYPSYFSRLTHQSLVTVALAIVAVMSVGLLTPAYAYTLPDSASSHSNSENQQPQGKNPVRSVGMNDLNKDLISFNDATGEMVVSKQWAQENKVEKDVAISTVASQKYPTGLARFVEAVESEDAHSHSVTLRTRPARLNEIVAGLNASSKKKLAEGIKGAGGKVATVLVPTKKEAQELAHHVDEHKGLQAHPSGQTVLDTQRNLVATNKNTVATPRDLQKVAPHSVHTYQYREANPHSPSLPGLLQGFGIHVRKPFGKSIPLQFHKTITKNSCNDGTFNWGAHLDPSQKPQCHWEGDGSLDVDLGLNVGANGELIIDTSGLKINEISLLGGAHLDGHSSFTIHDAQGHGYDPHGPSAIKGQMSWTVAHVDIPLTIPAGPVPIIINIGVDVNVNIKVDAQGNAQATFGGIKASYTQVGLKFSPFSPGPDGKAMQFLKGQPDLSKIDPNISADPAADLHAALEVQPIINVSLWNAIGIRAGLGAKIKGDFHIEPPNNSACMLGLGIAGTIGVAKVSVAKIPVIGWLLGAAQEKINNLITKKLTYRWDKDVYESPNLCANQPISIGDYVWIDKNGNGLQDKGEPGLIGARVILVRGIDKNAINDPKKIVATTLTDATGHYHFSADPSFTGVKIGPNKGKFAGKLMPGHYTVVVEPPTGGIYAKDYPYGFKPTQRYVDSGKTIEHEGKKVPAYEIDSGGKYLWDTNSYSSFFDGSLLQDAGDFEEAQQSASTKTYDNDAVDFGFVPQTKDDIHTSTLRGRVLANDTVQDALSDPRGGNPVYQAELTITRLPDGPVLPSPLASSLPTAPVTSLPGSISESKPSGIQSKSTATSTPSKDSSLSTVVRTGLLGNFHANLPDGRYRIEITKIPSGYNKFPAQKLQSSQVSKPVPSTTATSRSSGGENDTDASKKDAQVLSYSRIITMPHDSSSRLLPQPNWQYFHLTSLPNTVTGMAFVDTNHNGKLDKGELHGVKGVHIFLEKPRFWFENTNKAETTTNDNGLYSLSFVNNNKKFASQDYNMWTLKVTLPKGYRIVPGLETATPRVDSHASVRSKRSLPSASSLPVSTPLPQPTSPSTTSNVFDSVATLTPLCLTGTCSFVALDGHFYEPGDKGRSHPLTPIINIPVEPLEESAPSSSSSQTSEMTSGTISSSVAPPSSSQPTKTTGETTSGTTSETTAPVPMGSSHPISPSLPSSTLPASTSPVSKPLEPDTPSQPSSQVVPPSYPHASSKPLETSTSSASMSSPAEMAGSASSQPMTPSSEKIQTSKPSHSSAMSQPSHSFSLTAVAPHSHLLSAPRKAAFSAHACETSRCHMMVLAHTGISAFSLFSLITFFLLAGLAFILYARRHERKKTFS